VPVPIELSRKALRKAAARRSHPIAAYVGPNGGGKSLAAVHDTIPSLERGRPALSTVRLLDYANPRPCEGGAVCDDPAGHEVAGVVHPAAHPLYIPFTDFRQLVTFEFGDVVMDEVTGVASSRESAGLPYQVANFLVQLRRRDIALRWTTPSWARADKVIREVTGLVTYCTGYLPVERQDQDRLWRDRRLFMWRTYDAGAFDDFTTNKRETLRSSVRQLVWRPRSIAQHAYDTLAPVNALGFLDASGVCMDCEGRRTRHRCTCVAEPRLREEPAAPRSGARALTSEPLAIPPPDAGDRLVGVAPPLGLVSSP
jgi:hypothetical protein